MGCIQSSAGNPAQVPSNKTFGRRFVAANLAGNRISRPPLLSDEQIDDDTRNLIWDIIKRDSIKQFAFLLEQQEIPTNIQIQGKGTHWSLIHLAARWDAYSCLSYIISSYFDENPNTFIDFVNLQTIEGFSGLQLSIMWNAINCFHVFLNFGGLDLAIRDSRGADVFAIAASYKRLEMKQILDDFKRTGVRVLNINLNSLQQALQATDDIFLQEEEQEQYQLPKYKFQIDRNSDKFKQIQNFKQRQQEMLRINQQQLQQLAYENNNIHNNFYEQTRKNKQRQNQIIKQQKVSQPSDHGENFLYAIQLNQVVTPDQLRLQEQQRLRQQQLKRKQDEILEQQRKIKEQNELEARRFIQQQKQLEQKKILEFQNQKKQDQEKKNQQGDIQKKIQEQRQQLKKALQEKRNNLSNQTYQPVQNEITITEKPNINNCPPELQGLYNNLLASKKNFIDSTFQPRNQSIGSAEKLDADMKNCVWLRPAQIFNGKYQVFDGVDPNDIKQGLLGTCYYLSTLASLAQKQKRIRELFIFYNKQLGFYVIRLYVHGIPKNVVVDDYFPCFKGTNEPLFTKPNGNQIWVMILQKAWVKNFGTYLSAQAMSPDAMMEDVQGAPSQGYWIENAEQQFESMLKFDKLNYIMVLTSLSQNVPQGIVSQHAYSILDVYDINGLKLLKIRNPWGNTEWNGEYGSSSTKWTPDLKKKVGFKSQQDGQFFMTINQLPLGFNYYSVGMVKENYKYSYINFSSTPSQDLFFSFDIKNKIEVNIRVIQLNDRYLNDPSYQYSPLIFQVYKINGPQSVTFIAEGSDKSINGDKSVHFDQEQYRMLEPGIYNVRVRVLWKNSAKYKSATLVAYGQQTLNFSRLQNTKAMKGWKNMLRDYIKQQQQNQMTNGLSYSQLWTKSLYILCVKNTNNTAYEVTITYTPSTFINCRLGLKKRDTNKLVMKIRKSNGSNVGTIQKINLTDGCQIGSFNYEYKPIN